MIMATTVNNISKNTIVTVSNESRSGAEVTWAEATFTWDESYPSTWASVRSIIARETKNATVSMTNEPKI